MSRTLNFNVMQKPKERERDRIRRKKNMSEIARINELVRMQELSYGQYVGRYLSE